ncbi:MAG: protein phosphatase 2C domain-containing protein [Frankia sp.]|nr:protein phosphatase 2C domain-containing protein [Frankia sp.]
MTIAWRYAARSHVGMIREGNEDAAYAGPRVLAVADGMGGHAAGEVASAVAVASVSSLDSGDGDRDLLDALRSAVLEANAQLRDMVAADRDLDGMGTTITALLTDGPRAGLVHVGDSRAYLLRDGKLAQLTRDHTFVQQLVDEGRIEARDASSHPQRHLMTRALDGRDGLELDLSMREVLPGDRYLLCSDGLSGVVTDDTMAQALGAPDVQQAVDQLVDLALKAGGPDNITCVVAEAIDTPDRSAPAAPLVVGAATNGRPPATERDLGESPAARAAIVTAPVEDTAVIDVPTESPPPPQVPATAPVTIVPDDSVVGRGRTVRRRRLLLGVAAIVLLLLGGVAGAWAYVRAQYYVGIADGRVAIYRGVTGSFAGIDLSEVAAEPGPPVTALPEFERQRVGRGITAASLEDAHRIVSVLRAEAAPTPSPAPRATPSTVRLPSARPSR